jgi:uncharacterized caspase-like protein
VSWSGSPAYRSRPTRPCFFYAGHAIQYQGKNFLMPVDAQLEDEISIRYNLVSVDDVRSTLDRASGVKIMILDACRNNPIADRLNRMANGGQTRASFNAGPRAHR